MDKRKEILSRIIEKGGLMAAGAKMYINDEKTGNEFLMECFDQCHVPNLKHYWGESLIEDIIEYVLALKQSREVA